LFLNGGVPPDAGDRSHETGTEVESEKAGVSEGEENGRNGEVVREAIEKQVTDVFL
jgi:hypothetical protein